MDERFIHGSLAAKHVVSSLHPSMLLLLARKTSILPCFAISHIVVTALETATTCRTPRSTHPHSFRSHSRQANTPSRPHYLHHTSVRLAPFLPLPFPPTHALSYNPLSHPPTYALSHNLRPLPQPTPPPTSTSSLQLSPPRTLSQCPLISLSTISTSKTVPTQYPVSNQMIRPPRLTLPKSNPTTGLKGFIRTPTTPIPLNPANLISTRSLNCRMQLQPPELEVTAIVRTVQKARHTINSTPSIYARISHFKPRYIAYAQTNPLLNLGISAFFSSDSSQARKGSEGPDVLVRLEEIVRTAEMAMGGGFLVGFWWGASGGCVRL